MSHPVLKDFPQHILSAGEVQRFLGFKAKRAFYLLRKDPTEGFPAPFQMRGKDRWFVTDVVAWCESKRRTSANPGETALRAAA